MGETSRRITGYGALLVALVLSGFLASTIDDGDRFLAFAVTVAWYVAGMSFHWRHSP